MSKSLYKREKKPEKIMKLQCVVCFKDKPHGAFVCDSCVTKIKRQGRIEKPKNEKWWIRT